MAVLRGDDLRIADPALAKELLRMAFEGDPVNLGSGLFTYRKPIWSSPTSPIALTRVYRPADSDSCNSESGHDQQLRHAAVLAKQLPSAELILPDGMAIRYVPATSPGTGRTALSTRRRTPRPSSTPRRSPGTRDPGWVLRLRNGLKYFFAENQTTACPPSRTGSATG